MKKIEICPVFLLSFFLINLLVTNIYAAPTYDFEHISNNNETDIVIGEAQLHFEISESSNQFCFTFINAGPNASSIPDISFEDIPILLNFDHFGN